MDTPLEDFVDWVKNELQEFSNVMDKELSMEELLELFQEWLDDAAEPPTYE